MDRMVGVIRENLGCEVRILTTTPLDPNPDSFRGIANIPESQITRHVDDRPQSYAECWMDGFPSWFQDFDPDLLIFASPATYWQNKGPMNGLNQILASVRSRQIPFGFVHYDLAHTVNWEIGQMVGSGYTWESARDDYLSRAREASKEPTTWDAFVNRYEPPVAHEPDFLISCSEWSLRILDPLKSVPGFALHPFMDYPSYLEPHAPLDQGDFEIGFVNPSIHKGCTTALNLALGSPYSQLWLRGAYGDANKAKFMDMVDSTIASKTVQGEITIVDFVPDIRSFFASLDSKGLLIFPSQFEGYGMIAVEAMAAGIPVVSTDHPATVEGVGDSAYLVNPYAGFDEWEWAIGEVLDDRDTWVQAAADRITFLRDRQRQEVVSFIDFLQRFL